MNLNLTQKKIKLTFKQKNGQISKSIIKSSETKMKQTYVNTMKKKLVDFSKISDNAKKATIATIMIMRFFFHFHLIIFYEKKRNLIKKKNLFEDDENFN